MKTGLRTIASGILLAATGSRSRARSDPRHAARAWLTAGISAAAGAPLQERRAPRLGPSEVKSA
jgi:hypothetical protein